MPIVGQRAVGQEVGANQIFTFDVDSVPRSTFVVTALTGTIGGGTQWAGIAGCRTRPNPAQPDVNETFGDWPFWRSTLFRDQMTSVTCGVATGANQTAKGVFSFFFWS